MTKNLKILAFSVILASLALMIASSWDDSLIVDEIPHVGAGYSYLVKHDYRLNPEHPPLAKDIAAIPLLFMNLNQDAFSNSSWTTNTNGQWDFGRQLIYQTGNDARLITHIVMFPPLIFFILAALLILRWTRKLYGESSALIALTIFCFSPLVMAHSRFVTTDIPALFGVVISSYYFVAYLRHQTRRNLIIAALTFGLALLTKFSTILLVPSLGLLSLVYPFARKESIGSIIRSGFKAVLIFAVGFIFVVWPVYYFNSYNYPAEHQLKDTTEILASQPGILSDIAIWASDKPVIRSASHYLFGLLMANQRQAGGNTVYFLGEVSREGSHFYFPYVYLVKEPLTWWAMVILAIAFAYWHRQKLTGNQKLRKWLAENTDQVAMILWLVIYWAISINSRLNIGARHILPIYPFTIILVSGQLGRLMEYYHKKQMHFRVLVMFLLIPVLLGLYVFESTSAFPFYLPYFNQIAGGPDNAYKNVVDSNLDWGQDLNRLAIWLKQNNVKEINLDYFGWADPAYYIPVQDIRWMHAGLYHNIGEFMQKNPQGGYLAVSATFYMNSRQDPTTSYAWLDHLKPVAVIGHSIFVWHITP